MSDIIFITEWQMTLMLLVCIAGGVMAGLGIASFVKEPVVAFEAVERKVKHKRPRG